MVNPTSGIGPVSGLNQQNRTEQTQTDRQESRSTETSQAAVPRDEVQLSQEALSLLEAEQTAQQIRDALSSDQSLSLANSADGLDA